jgi:diacylglycerol O-acyltransferase / wax synthase
MLARMLRTYGPGVMNDHLTALDATFLELEEADETAHMHVGSLAIFEPPADGAPPALDEIATTLETRMGALPRFRQRLSERHTGGLRWPRWEVDPHFDIRNHLTRAALPAPGGEAELFAWVSDYWSYRLDRARPLWEIVLVEGLEGGRWALASKTHHCMVDGVSSVDVGYVVLDAEPQPGPLTWGRHDVPGVRDGGSIIGSALGLVTHLVDPRNLPDLMHRSRAAASMLVRDELIAAPDTSLNDPIGTRRRIASVTVDLDELKEIKRELGGTVNDVVLSVVAGGLRSLLISRGEDPPEEGLRAMVPVNIRAAGEHLELGNRITSLFAHLPVAVADPLARYQAMCAETATLKASSEAEGSKAVIDLAGLAPPALHATLARALFATRLFNVTVTNVPGPPETLYGFGSALDQVFGLVPLAAEHALGVCVVSYAGEVTFTIAADHDSVSDIDVFAQGIRDSIEALRAALVPA